MSTIAMIGSVILAWILLAILAALVVGRIIRQRDGHRPAEDRSTDATSTARTLAPDTAESRSAS